MVSGVRYRAIFWQVSYDPPDLHQKEVAYAGRTLFGPVVGDLGLDGNFDIVNILPALSRVPEFGLGAASYHQMFSLSRNLESLLDRLAGLSKDSV